VFPRWCKYLDLGKLSLSSRSIFALFRFYRILGGCQNVPIKNYTPPLPTRTYRKERSLLKILLSSKRKETHTNNNITMGNNMSTLFSLIVEKTKFINGNESVKGFYLPFCNYLQSILVSSLFALLLNPTSASLLSRDGK
jgi:hypothetical protein